MATSTVEYTERTATITVVTENAAIDFTSRYFHIDILNSIHAYYNMDLNSTIAKSDNDKLDADNLILRINYKNVKDYIGTSKEQLLAKGMQIWAEDTNILKIRMHDLMDNGYGFTANEVTIDIPNPSNPVEVERINTHVLLYPKLIQGNIELVNPDDADKDIQLKSTERRPDFVWCEDSDFTDTMYVNTDGGTNVSGVVSQYGISITKSEKTQKPVPKYCLKTSALLPEAIYFDMDTEREDGIGFLFEGLSSCLLDTFTNVKTQDIPYDITEMDDFKFEDNGINCKRWLITQYIINENQNEFNMNQLYLGLPTSGMFYNLPDDIDNAILHENYTTIGYETTGHILR